MRKKKVLLAGVALAMAFLSMVMLSGCGHDKNALYIYNFGDYIDPDLIEEFTKETGIKVVYSTFDTNEELYPVIRNRTASYDVICASDYMLEKMLEEKMLTEMDYDQIPNSEFLMPEFSANIEKFDKGAKHVVPHTWGTMGIMYNTEKIPEGSVKSWNDLWNEKYSSSIVMPDSMRDTMAVALKAKGYSLNTTKKKELAAATKYLIKQKPMVYKYANDAARDLLVGNSADIGVIWSGEYIYCQELNPSLRFVIPEEGSEQFIDGWAIPKEAENKKAAYKWINFMLSKKAALKNFDYLYYTIPNKQVKIGIDEKFSNDRVIFPLADDLKSNEALRYLGPDGDKLYTDYWKEFKSE